MASQPYDEHNDFDNNRIEVSQYSENFNRPSQNFPSFSSILRPSLASSSTNDVGPLIDEDPSDLLKCDDIVPEMQEAIDNFLKNNLFDQEMQMPDDILQYLSDELTALGLRGVDRSIVDREMSVEIQPPTNIRRRYESDGHRQIEKSRSKPVIIKLPQLKGHITGPEQTVWLELLLTTTDRNRAGKVYIHVDHLEYHASDIETDGDGFVRVPVTPADIDKGVKELARISIIKAKLDTYTCKLMPLNASSTDEPLEIYENDSVKSVVAKAKCFREVYNLNFSQISFRLLIKQNQVWHKTDIKCESIIVEENVKLSKNTKKGKKRSTPSETSDEDDDEETPVSRQTFPKKQKSSSPSKESLPVYHTTKT